MLDSMQKFFKDQYQFSLKEVIYNRLDITPDHSSLKVSDEIIATVINETLNISFTRTIHFIPDAAFYLKVTFDVVLWIKDGMMDAASKIEWTNELVETENPYLANILTRASSLIANITSSYGQQPIITPPGFIKTE